MNWTVAARGGNPGNKIIPSKIGCRSAYRQCHLNVNTAIQTCTQLLEEDLAIVVLCLPFGGPPGPYEWGVLPDSICDLSIAIMQDAGWDPTSLCATNGHIVPPPLIMDEYIPFSEEKDLVIDVLVDTRGIADVYIDDTIALQVDVEDSNNDKRIEQTTLLAIHCSAQEKHNDEPIQREEMAARAKNLA